MTYKEDAEEEAFWGWRRKLAEEKYRGEPKEGQFPFLEQWEKDAEQFRAQYPGSDGCEMATLQENGDISIDYFSVDEDGSHGHGSRTYKPGDKDYEAMWKYHKFDNREGKVHYIMQKFDQEKRVWIDLGDGWN